MAKVLTDEEVLAYKDKETTDVQIRFADWLIEKLGIKFTGNAKEVAAKEAAFREAVRLASALRNIFQVSPENQAVLAKRRSPTEEVPETPPPAAAKGGKGKKAKAADEEPKAVPVEAPAETPPPAKAKRGNRKAAVVSATVEVPAKAENADEAVAPPAKPSAPRKAAARGNKDKPAPF